MEKFFNKLTINRLFYLLSFVTIIILIFLSALLYLTANTGKKGFLAVSSLVDIKSEKEGIALLKITEEIRHTIRSIIYTHNLEKLDTYYNELKKKFKLF